MAIRRGNQNNQQFQPRQTSSNSVDSSDKYLRSSGASLYAITKHLKENNKTGGFDQKLLTGWDNRILLIAKSLAITKHKLLKSTSIVQSELAEKRKYNDENKNEESKQTNIDTKAEIIKIKKTLDNEMNKFIVDNDKLVQDIKQLFDKHAEDDDIEEVEVEETILTYTCAYTAGTMKDDLIMKNSSCIHKLSKTAVDSCLKSSPHGFKCPVSGCSKMWLKNSIENDVIMQTKMKAFFSQPQSSQSQRRNTHVVDLEDDYTQL